MNGFIGSVTLFAGSFAPRNWALCQGQLISIASNTALFSILGTTYGGNGTTTFALPDLRGRAVVGAGQGPGLSMYSLGQIGGTETTTLLSFNIPAHTHTAAVQIQPNAASAADQPSPGNDVYATAASGEPFYGPAPTAQMQAYPGTLTTASTGNSLPFSNLHPELALCYIVCVRGIFPARN
jgi:microcystin-dependent protein